MSRSNRAASLSAPDRRALAAVATQFFINGALPASFIPRLPEIRDRVDIGIAEVGLLISLAGITGLVGSIVVGPLIERFGTRRVILASGVFISASLGVIGLATTPLILLIGLIGMTAFDVLVDVSMNMQASWLSARRHTPVMNRLHGLWSLGTVIGGLAASWIAAAGISLQAHLISAGTILLLALIYVGRGLLRVDEVHESNGEISPTSRRRMLNPTLVLFALAGVFAVTLESTSSDWAAFRLVDDFGVGAGYAGLGFIAATAGMTIGRFSGDWAVVRLGTYRLLLVAAALAGLGLTVASLTSSRAATIAGFLIAGLGTSTMLPRLYDDAAKLPGKTASGLGALTAGVRIGILVVPAIVGALAATSLSVGGAIAIVTLPCVAGFLVVAMRLHSTAGVFSET